MKNNGRLVCPLCRQEHNDGTIKPGMTLCLPCSSCKANYDIEEPPRQTPPPLEEDGESILRIGVKNVDSKSVSKKHPV